MKIAGFRMIRSSVIKCYFLKRTSNPSSNFILVSNKMGYCCSFFGGVGDGGNLMELDLMDPILHVPKLLVFHYHGKIQCGVSI
jgi:hypothetical protein